jgi:hypothetical protein
MDDVLVHSEPMKDQEFAKFKKHVEWCNEASELFYPTAAILCSEIQDFPECIEWIRSGLDEGKLYIDLHGWEHVDYAKLHANVIDEHLEKSFEFMLKHFGCLPIRWATPWGRHSDDIRTACRKFSLRWEGTQNPVLDQGIAMKDVRESGSIDCLQGKVVMVHWFERGLKLWRIVQTGIHGSWDAAAQEFPKEFKPESPDAT